MESPLPKALISKAYLTSNGSVWTEIAGTSKHKTLFVINLKNKYNKKYRKVSDGNNKVELFNSPYVHAKVSLPNLCAVIPRFSLFSLSLLPELSIQ